MSILESYGWNPSLQGLFSQRFHGSEKPGRVIVQQSAFEIISEEGPITCTLAGRLKYLAAGAEDLPVIGDWVGVEIASTGRKGRIVDILPRKTRFVRKAPGNRTVAQVLAANVDLLFLISGLDEEFNLNRIERYLVLARESGAVPIIVLNKTDMSGDVQSAITLTGEAAPNVRLITMSARTGEGFDELAGCLHPQETGALLGSSGVGKSSILNLFLGSDRMKVQEVRTADGRGRHTTKHRELILLPSGGMLIDTPGMRELQLWGEGRGVQDTFDDVEELALQCKFSNCRHETEPGCAVRTAVENQTLDAGRLESYQKLQRELLHLKEKFDVRTRIQNKRAVKKISAAQRRWSKRKGLE
ncbi:MAG: ribosome small subunit-dependent GTPase A [Bacteroidota bacterium]